MKKMQSLAGERKDPLEPLLNKNILLYGIILILHATHQPDIITVKPGT